MPRIRDCVVVVILIIGIHACPPAAFAWISVMDDAPALSERVGHGRTEVFSSLRGFAGNDWTAVSGITGNWSGRYSPRSGRNLAIGFVQGEVGVGHGAWRISYVNRQEAIVDASRDTLDLIYLEKNNLPIAVGRRFDLHLDAEVFKAEGLKVDRAFELYRGEFSALRASVGAAFLKGSYTRSSDLKGIVTATGANQFSFDVAWNDIYSEKTFRFIKAGSPDGTGYAVDAAVEFEWDHFNRLSLSVADLYARIAWRDVPATMERANSATATRDAQGFIVYQPAIVGQNSRTDYIQHLDPKTTFQYSRALGPVSIGAGALVVRGIVIPRISIEFRPDAAWRFGIDHDFRFGSVGLALKYKLLSVAVSSELRGLDNSRSLGVAAQLLMPF